MLLLFQNFCSISGNLGCDSYSSLFIFIIIFLIWDCFGYSRYLAGSQHLQRGHIHCRSCSRRENWTLVVKSMVRNVFILNRIQRRAHIEKFNREKEVDMLQKAINPVEILITWSLMRTLRMLGMWVERSVFSVRKQTFSLNKL